MAKIKVLIEGYAKRIKGGWLASSTTTLVKDSNKNIIIDPGISRKLLLEKLKRESLAFDDVDIVFLTHYHPDHVFLAAALEKAIIVDGDTVYREDREIEYKGKIPGTNLTAIPTPGHTYEHCALLVPTDKGNVVVAGDVFWWMGGEKQVVSVNKEDPFTEDSKDLVKSRKKILEIADWIIPGHGKVFENPKK